MYNFCKTPLWEENSLETSRDGVYGVQFTIINIHSNIPTVTYTKLTSIDLGSIPKPIVGLTLKADTIQWAGRSGTGTVKR